MLLYENVFDPTTCTSNAENDRKPSLLVRLCTLRCARNTITTVVIEWASKVSRHRRQFRRNGIVDRDGEIDDIAELSREASCKCLIDQAHGVASSLLVELAIANV